MRRLLAFEMRCYRRLLSINWYQKVPSKEVRKKVEPGYNVVQQVIRRKLGLFGHVCRMKDDRLVKSVMFGMMEGTNKKGRPKRKWLDDIQEWCGKRVDDIRRDAMNRPNWKKCVDRAVNTNGHWAQGD